MNKLVMIKILAFNGEQDITIRFRRDQHHRCCAADAECVLVRDDFHSAGAVAEFCRGIFRDPDCCVGIDQLRRLVRKNIFARPCHFIITFAFRREKYLCLAVRVGFQTLRKNVVMFVAAKFQSPVLLIRPCRRGWPDFIFSLKSL